MTRIYVVWTLIMTNYDNSFLLFLSRQAPMILKKIFNWFLPVRQRKRFVPFEVFLALQASPYVAERVFRLKWIIQKHKSLESLEYFKWIKINYSNLFQRKDSCHSRYSCSIKRNYFLFYVTYFPIYVCKCHVLFINLQMQKSFIDFQGTCSRGSTGRATIKKDWTYKREIVIL